MHIRPNLIRDKYGKLYKNSTASLESYWQLGCQDSPQFPRLLNSKAKSLETLAPGDSVYVQNQTGTKPHQWGKSAF